MLVQLRLKEVCVKEVCVETRGSDFGGHTHACMHTHMHTHTRTLVHPQVAEGMDAETSVGAATGVMGRRTMW
jgi:hypothetical protein